MANQNSSNDLLVPGATQAIDQMKLEIASEFGVNLGADTTSRANGSVGGEITKRLVSFAQQRNGRQSTITTQYMAMRARFPRSLYICHPFS